MVSTTPQMNQVRDSKVRYMISPEAWRTISPKRKAVRISTRLRRLNINTSWTVSDHVKRPTRELGGISFKRLTMENFIGYARLGANEYGPWYAMY